MEPAEETHEDIPVDAQTSDGQLHPPRRRWRGFLVVLGVLLVIIAAAGLIPDRLYRGPQDLDDVTRVMPGIPLFPISRVSPANRLTQRLMAIPIVLLRKQGAQQAEIVLLNCPGDAEFIDDWYEQLAPSQRWTLVKKEGTVKRMRLLFQRDREGLQVYIGASNGLYAPVQVIYLQCNTAEQCRKLLVKE